MKDHQLVMGFPALKAALLSEGYLGAAVAMTFKTSHLQIKGWPDVVKWFLSVFNTEYLRMFFLSSFKLHFREMCWSNGLHGHKTIFQKTFWKNHLTWMFS